MRTFLGLVVAVGVWVGLSSADAQVVGHTVFFPAAPTTFVQTSPVVQTTFVQPTTVYRPVVRRSTRMVTPLPTTVYTAPQTVVVARPTVPVAVVQPAPVVTTRRRPILGGTVTRVWYP